LPFLRSLVWSDDVGLAWFVPVHALSPAVLTARAALVALLEIASWLAPLVWVARLAVGRRVSVPMISILVVARHVVGWLVLDYMGAFVVASVFRSIQYLAIVTIFHVRDRQALPGNTHGAAFHAASFYAACLALGYLLFNVWPWAYVRMGFGLAESMLLSTATINVHHFIVDASIWRLKRGSNTRIVAAPAPSLAGPIPQPGY